MIKPDAIKRHLEEMILNHFVQQGFRVVRHRTVKVKRKTILSHYDHVIERIGKGTFRQYIYNEFVGNNVIVCILEHEDENFISLMKEIVGATDPVLASSDSIRGIYGNDSLSQARDEHRMLRNLVHVSDSTEAFIKEINVWF